VFAATSLSLRSAEAMTAVIPLEDYRRTPSDLYFSRDELIRLLNLYTSRVMQGLWRDYAISHGPTAASFFIFRHTNESPLFVISKLETRGKNRVAAARNGRFVLFYRQKKIRQAHDLEAVLHMLSRSLALVSN
jgi:hypothetical protein